MKILMFAKMLKNTGQLNLDEAGDRISNMGFDGVDLTVRPMGYVSPERAREDLPQAIDLLRSKGLEVPLITTDITDAGSAYSEDIFRTASECGVSYIKLGYWGYEGFGKIRSQIDEVRGRLETICSLSKRYGIIATVHTHAGPYVSADPALLFLLLREFHPGCLGAYIDPGHMFAEVGPSGWEMGIDLLTPYIKLVAVKNYRWMINREGETGQVRWKMKMMPLREEIVPWPAVFRCLRDMGFEGCISMHSEYEELNLKELIAQTEDDLRYIRGILEMNR